MCVHVHVYVYLEVHAKKLADSGRTNLWKLAEQHSQKLNDRLAATLLLVASTVSTPQFSFQT